jgi:hypothetical protein
MGECNVWPTLKDKKIEEQCTRSIAPPRNEYWLITVSGRSGKLWIIHRFLIGSLHGESRNERETCSQNRAQHDATQRKAWVSSWETARLGIYHLPPKFAQEKTYEAWMVVPATEGTTHAKIAAAECPGRCKSSKTTGDPFSHKLHQQLIEGVRSF